MKISNNTYKFLSIIVLAVLIIFISCQTDPEVEPDKNETEENDEEENNNNGSNNPAGQFTSDELSSFLVFTDSTTKIQGELPTAPDGQLKTDVKDTIYVVKGYPLGNRLQFKHKPGQNVTGFYIYVGSASYYVDVPEEETDREYVPPQESDTTSVLVLDLDIPEDEEVDYPLTTDIVIQPHNESKMPLDKFDRWVTVEDPEDVSGNGCNDITQPYEGLDTPPRWRWDFTTRQYNGEILNFFAPNRKQRINTQGAGCCSDNGNSYYAGETPGCVPNVSGNGMTWVTLDNIDDYVVRYEEYMWVFDNGVFDVQGIEDKKNWWLFTTDFCAKEPDYTYSYQVYGSPNDTPVGTHDFTPGATQINLDLNNWQGPYRMPSSANIIYTCHTLLLQWGVNDLFTSRYEDYTTALSEYHD